MNPPGVIFLVAFLVIWGLLLLALERYSRRVDRRKAQRKQVKASVQIIDLRQYRPINSKGM